jgi:hypothetical protein
MSHVTIDGRDYELDKLSEPARQQAININLVDQEIRRLQFQLAICQTARNAGWTTETSISLRGISSAM